MAKIKYMGTADVRKLEKGEDFGGQLATPLDRDIEWNWDNRHVIDTEEIGLSEAVVTLLLEQDDFKDVSGQERIPVNEAQKLWKQMRGTEVDPSVKSSGTAETDESEAKVGGTSEASDTAAGTTTVGGSTRGRGRSTT